MNLLFLNVQNEGQKFEWISICHLHVSLLFSSSSVMLRMAVPMMGDFREIASDGVVKSCCWFDPHSIDDSNEIENEENGRDEGMLSLVSDPHNDNSHTVCVNGIQLYVSEIRIKIGENNLTHLIIDRNNWICIVASEAMMVM